MNQQFTIDQVKRKRRKGLMEKSYYSSLILSPFDLGTIAATNPLPNSITLPFSGNIGISFSNAVTATELSVTTNRGRTLGTKALAANEIHRLGFFERNVSLTPTSTIAGIVTLHYLDYSRLDTPIATGTVT